MRHLARQIQEVAGAHGLATAMGSDINRTFEAVHRNRTGDSMLGQFLACEQNESRP